MKSRVRTYSKKEIGWLCGEAMPEIDRCINANGLVFLIAVSRHTGWKQKRMEDFIKTLNETMDEYHQHTIDDVFDCMAERELKEIGLSMNQVLPESLPFMQQLRKSKLAKKPNVNVTEAKKLHEEMIGFHGYFKTKED